MRDTCSSERVASWLTCTPCAVTMVRSRETWVWALGGEGTQEALCSKEGIFCTGQPSLLQSTGGGRAKVLQHAFAWPRVLCFELCFPQEPKVGRGPRGGKGKERGI